MCVCVCHLALTRYCLTSKLDCGSPSSFYCPPTCKAYPIAIILHAHFAIYAPHRPPVCMPYTIQYWLWQYRLKANSFSAEVPPLYRAFSPISVFTYSHPTVLRSQGLRCDARARLLSAPSLFIHTLHLRALLSVCGRCSFGGLG